MISTQVSAGVCFVVCTHNIVRIMHQCLCAPIGPQIPKHENTPICLSLCTHAPDSYILELESRQFLENANPQKHTRIIPLHTTLGSCIGEGRDIDMFFS
jgi:hypothetical protein